MERPSDEPSPGQTGVTRCRRTANAPPRMSRLAPASPPTTAAVPASSDGRSNDDPEPGVAGAGAVARSRAVVASPVPIAVAIAGSMPRATSVASSFPGTVWPRPRAWAPASSWIAGCGEVARRGGVAGADRGGDRGVDAAGRQRRLVVSGDRLAEAACLGAELVVDAGCGEVACRGGVAGCRSRWRSRGRCRGPSVSPRRFRGPSGRGRVPGRRARRAPLWTLRARSLWPPRRGPGRRHRSPRERSRSRPRRGRGRPPRRTAPLLPPPPPSRTCPDAVEAISAAEEDAAATSSTISRIPCPSKSGCSSAR